MKKLLLILTIAAFLTGSAYAGTITMTYPNGGESLCKSSTCTITWTSSGITSPLRIVLVKGPSRLGDIVLALPAGTTSYTWTVGNYIGGTAPVGTDYRIRVRIDTAGDPGTEADFSDAFFTIKNCVTRIDPHKYEYAQKFICKWPPGCPGCPPDIDMRGWRERFGNPGAGFRLVLLKDGKPIQNLHSFGQGKGLPNSVSPKLGRADLGLLKNGKGNFALGLVGPDGKLANSYEMEVQ